MTDTFDLGLWLLEHKFVLLASISALGAATRLLLKHQARAHATQRHRLEQAAHDVSDRELELAAKFLQTLHLSEPERDELPERRLRFPALVCAARVELARFRSLPPGGRRSNRSGGATLELRGETYWVHRRGEPAVGRSSPPVPIRVASLEDAVRRYLEENGAFSVDGIVAFHPFLNDGS